MSVELMLCVWFINVWNSNNLCLIFKKICNIKNFATLVKFVWWNCIREAVQSSNILNFVWKKIISQPWFVQKYFFSIQTLFSLNTKWLYFFGTPLAPPGVKKAKCLFFGSFQESHFRTDLHVGCHPEKPATLSYVYFLSYLKF